jgi:hypothetical protein
MMPDEYMQQALDAMNAKARKLDDLESDLREAEQLAKFYTIKADEIRKEIERLTE